MKVASNATTGLGVPSPAKSAAKSTTRSNGLVGDSTSTRRVVSRRRGRRAPSSSNGTSSTSIPHPGSTVLRSSSVPPYISAEASR